jgi:LCP family protein required for cell wall assembly
VVNILLLGSDARSPEGGFRTDVLILLSLHPQRRTAVMISIPRDLYVYLPGYSMQRINTAFQIGENVGYPGGGPGLLADTVRYNLGLPVHHFIRVEMDGFRRIIDALGGVDVSVACSYRDWRLKDPDLNPNVEANWELFTVPRGVVHMDGDYALWYARARRHSSDFDRSRRQHEVLRAAYRQSLRLNLLPRIPTLYDELRSSFSSDLTLPDLLELAPLATRFDLSSVQSRFIGRDQVISWRVPRTGAQVLVPRPEAIQSLLQSALEAQAVDPLIPEQPPTVEVVNASGQPDWPALAAERLNYAGYAAYMSSRSEALGTNTLLVDYGLAQAGEADRLLRALGLGTPRWVSLPDPSSPFQFQLVLGTDYDPCYNPTVNQG